MPFLLHQEHEGAVAGWSIEGPKGHDIEGVEDVPGGTEAELLSVTESDGDLVEAGFGINTDPEEVAGARGKVVNGLVAAGNGEAVGQGDSIEPSVVDAEPPDEVGNVLDVFLVWLGSQNNWGEPPTEVREDTDPVHVQEGFQLLFHDDRLMDTIPGRSAGHRSGGASVDAELKVKDRSVDASGGEGIPIGLDDPREGFFVGDR